MNRLAGMVIGCLGILAYAGGAIAQSAPAGSPAVENAKGDRPNIVFILADDLGWADLGCYGQEKIKTPRLDRMAAEGIRFTQAYCGTSVCGPSRCILMTGLHAGHSHIRANRGHDAEGEMPLLPNAYTVARMLQQAGYRTACIGKWGLGSSKSTGAPNKQGFDYFFGYTGHGQAHEYYPDHLWRNGQRVELDGKTYSHDLFIEEALKWIDENRDQRFFLYLPVAIPHAKLQVPHLGPYAKEKWMEPAKLMAAMITRMDSGVGQILDRLKELGLDEKTVVFFAGDNGPDRGGVRQFFKASDTLRGGKRGMYEGGLRVPMIVRWPGHSPAGKVCDEPWAFWDFLPTCAELAGMPRKGPRKGVRSLFPERPEGCFAEKAPDPFSLDGISVVPALLGKPMATREYFYWEIHEPWSSQAVRFGDWKAVRPAFNAPIELYNLKTDRDETQNVAAHHPDLVKKAEQLLKTARVDSPDWPIKHPTPGATRPVAASRPKGRGQVK